MTTTLDIHREQRELLLAGIANELAMDEHFLGGWLTGNYAGSEAEALSDIVVADMYSEVLMLELKDRVSEFIDTEPLTPSAEIGKSILLVQDSNHQSKIINHKS